MSFQPAENNQQWFMHHCKQYSTIHTYREFEPPYDVVGKQLAISDGDFKRPIASGASVRPVLLALCLGALLEVGDHYNSADPLLPHQPPEVHKSLGERT